MKRTIIVAAVAALAIWGAADQLRPTRNDLRSFDPHELARLETEMWRSYYDRKTVRLYFAMSELLRQQYRLSWTRSQIAAYHATKAAFLFKGGHSRSDYERALPDLRAFYESVRRDSTIAFEPDEVASRELEWWIIHRERARYGEAALEKSLAELQSRLYALPPELFQAHAAARAQAMILRDDEAGRGGVSESEWRQTNELLDRSWSALHDAVRTGGFVRE